MTGNRNDAGIEMAENDKTGCRRTIDCCRSIKKEHIFVLFSYGSIRDTCTHLLCTEEKHMQSIADSLSLPDCGFIFWNSQKPIENRDTSE